MKLPEIHAHFNRVKELKEELDAASGGQASQQDLSASQKAPIEKERELVALLQSYRGTAAYAGVLSQVKNEFSKMLYQGPEYNWMARNWDALDLDIQKSYLKSCTDLLASIFSKHGQVAMTGPDIEWYYSDAGDIGKTCFFPYNKDCSADRIILNASQQAAQLTSSLECALNSLSHEQTHHFHNNLNRALLLKQLPEDHILYEDALYFKDMWDNRLVITAPQSVYKAQFDEAAATSFGRAIERRALKVQQTNMPVLAAA